MFIYHKKLQIPVKTLRELSFDNWQYWSNLRALTNVSLCLFCFVLVFMGRDSSGYKKLFYGFIHGKQLGKYCPRMPILRKKF
jgi:hypothetical protein